MKFTSPTLVSESIWQMRLADLPRGDNRASIDSLMDGNPPYTEAERQANNIEINVNFLDGTQLCADARRSYYNGFQSPGKFFSVSIDDGPPYSRIKWGNKITQALKKIMKGNRLYAEVLDSQFASCTLHGIGPAVWIDKEKWVPEEKGVEDVMIPSGTLRSMRNLDHFAVFCQYTPEQLYRLTHGPRRDPAWNMPMVESALQWAHNQTQSQLGYNDIFSPEKVEQRFKQDLGFYGTDAVPTIDFWKFYYHEDKKNEMGWRMRMVLDTPGSWEIAGRNPTKSDRKAKMPKNLIGVDNAEWLYNPGDRVYASNIEELAHFQFADLSAVAPFRYHSIRSLGWLLYAVCHLQNRLLGKYNEAVFESLMQYFRCNEQDRTRVQKIDLHNFGVIPDGVNMVRPEERWAVNEVLVENAIDRNRQRMDYSASQYRQREGMGQDQREKTATQIMAEVNSSMSMVGSMLTQAYRYQFYQYREICRRFCIKNSSDPDVKRFRAEVLAAGVPEKVLNHELWNIEIEKVLGQGNATLKIAMADALLQMRPLLDPESQRIVDRINISAKSDSDDLAERLVPEVKTVSSSAHDAANSFATLMLGMPVPIMNGTNHVDAIETLLSQMALVIQKAEQRGGMAKPDEITGLQSVAQHIGQHIQILSQNPAEKERVRQYGQELSELMNLVKAYQQRLQEAMQKRAEQGNGQGGLDPETAAKIQATQLQAQVKAENARSSHAEKTAQRRISFEQQTQQKAQEHGLKMRQEAMKTRAEVGAEDIKTAAEIRREGAKAVSEAQNNVDKAK